MDETASYKYSLEGFRDLAGGGLALERVWTDDHRWFSVQCLTAGQA